MPELPEVEAYRRLAGEAALARPIAGVTSTDTFVMKRGTTEAALVDALLGEQVLAARRIGKQLLLDVSNGHVLGIHFGMAGTLVVDDEQGVRELWYSSHRLLPQWDRFTLAFADGGRLRLNDSRRLSAVVLDPAEDALGVDALGLTFGQLRTQLGTSRAPLKARLLDQRFIAGVGNLIADETLWRAALDPARAANSLSEADLRRLHRHLRTTVDDLIARGGSHTGTLMAERHRGGRCPKDGEELLRRTVGGRTTFSCPKHQR